MATATVAATSKVPQATLVFWIAKIAATTVGETGGDALSMSMHLGYALSTAIFMIPFLVLLFLQIRARQFHAPLYWAVIVGTTLAGTTMADFADRSLGIGYAGGSTLLFLLVLASFAAWKLAVGSVSVDTILTPRAEAFYWVTILCSNTLGTALGDWTSSVTGFGGGALLFLGALAVIALLHFFTRASAAILFWSAFVLSRPLGANLGDLLTKPHGEHGLALNRFLATGLIALFMVIWLAVFPQKSGGHPGAAKSAN